MRTPLGLLFVAPYPFKNRENGAVMGVTMGESQEAFQAAMAAIADLREPGPSPAWEIRPTGVYWQFGALAKSGESPQALDMGMKAGSPAGDEWPHGCRFCACQVEWRCMGQQTVRKTYKYKLHPTSQQERELGRVLMLCRHVYNAAVGQRREA
jgi:hypothetical protein